MTEKKQFKSLLAIPVRVEMSEVQHNSNNALTVEQLAVQIEEAKKGKARVDSKYVGYDNKGHLFDYHYDYVRFLENMKHIIKEAKDRKEQNAADLYKNPHRMIMQ